MYYLISLKSNMDAQVMTRDLSKQKTKTIISIILPVTLKQLRLVEY